VAIDSAQTTGPGEWRKQSPENRQGSEELLDREIGELLSEEERELQARAREVYERRLEQGVAREQARKDLPLSTYTEAYWKIDLHNLLHFLALRLDPHAQAEIRAYSQTIGDEIVRRWCPIAWEAFEDYRLNALRLTRIEKEVIRCLCRHDAAGALRIAEASGLLSRGAEGLKRNRERQELERKLDDLGLRPPWLEPPPPTV
jgi:thymidylate synthase (FAD)